MSRKGWESMVIFVIGITCVILYTLWVEGGTFGHRCAKVYPYPSAAYKACVARLASGGTIK
jgi:hypothetical protein